MICIDGSGYIHHGYIVTKTVLVDTFIYSGIPISRTLGFPNLPIFRPNLVSLGFASLKLYNFTPDFSNPRFLETHDNWNQFWLPWDKLTLDTSNLWKFPKYLPCMLIKFTLLNKLGTSIICAKVPGTFLKS